MLFLRRGVCDLDCVIYGIRLAIIVELRARNKIWISGRDTLLVRGKPRQIRPRVVTIGPLRHGKPGLKCKLSEVENVASWTICSCPDFEVQND